MEIVDLFLEDSVVRHSMGNKWLLLQSHTTQPCSESLALTPPEESCCRFSLSAAIWTLCRSELISLETLKVERIS